MFRYELIDAENAETNGTVAFIRNDFKPGDTVEVEIGSVGRLVNPVRKEAR